MGRRPLIERSVAVQTAIDIVDSDGPTGLSLERIAVRLNVRAPSLYNHFRDKNEILAEVARAIVLQTPPHDPIDDGDWQQWLIEGAVMFRSALLAHARAVPLVVEHFPAGLLEKLYATHCAVLDEHGVPSDRQMFIVESVHRMTIGSAMCAATGRPAMTPVTDPSLFSREVAASLDGDDWNDDVLFVEMLRVFLQGIGAEIA